MEKPPQHPQEGEGLNMPLATTPVKEDDSGASGMLRGTSMIWIDLSLD